MRVVFSLPERARRLIAGRPVRVDGQELALDAQLLLRLRHLTGAAGLAADTPARSRALMSESTALIEGRRIETVRTRDLMIPGDDGPIRARLYVPEGLPEGSPLLLYFHGGGFVIGDLETHDNLCRLLAKHSDVRVLSADYRLAPENPFPASVNDGISAYRYCVENAVQLGANPAAIALGEDSAGGNVAAVTAHSAARNGDSRPAFLLLFYPAVDDDDLIHGYATMFGVSRRFQEAVFEAVGALRTGLTSHRLDPEGSVVRGSTASDPAAHRG